MPHFDNSVSANRIHGRVILVEQHSVNRVRMSLQFRSNFALLHIDHANLTVRAANSHNLCVLIEGNRVCDVLASVDGKHLLHHSDVPDLHNSVGVARRDVLASDRELSVVDRVQMTVEGLNSEASPHVPD